MQLVEHVREALEEHAPGSTVAVRLPTGELVHIEHVRLSLGLDGAQPIAVIELGGKL